MSARSGAPAGPGAPRDIATGKNPSPPAMGRSHRGFLEELSAERPQAHAATGRPGTDWACEVATGKTAKIRNTTRFTTTPASFL